MKHTLYLTSLAVFLFTASACQTQPTPATELSVTNMETSAMGKTKASPGNTGAAEVESTPTIRDQTPLTYRDTWISGNLTWEIDAEVVVPDRESMPKLMATSQLEHLDTETVDRVIEVFFGDRDYYSMDYDSDSSNLPEDMGYTLWALDITLKGLDQYRCCLEELERKQAMMTEEEQNEIYNYYMDRIETHIEELADIDYSLLLKNQYKIRNFVFSDGVKEEAPDMVEVYAPMEEPYCDSLIIGNQERADELNFIKFASYDPNHDYSKTEEEMSFSRNQAVAKAEEYLQALKIDFLEVTEIRFEHGYYKILFGLKNDAEIPHLNRFHRGSWFHIHEDDNFDDPSNIATETSLYMGYISLDETHLSRAYLPLTEFHLQEEGSWEKLVDFEEMTASLKTCFEEAAAEMEVDDTVATTTYINKIYLTNIYVRTEWKDRYEENSYHSIPVWILMGSFIENRPLQYGTASDVYIDVEYANSVELYAYCYACNPEEVTFTRLDLSPEMDQYIADHTDYWYRKGRSTCNFGWGI